MADIINALRQFTSDSSNRSFKIRIVAFGVTIAVVSFVLLAIGWALSDFASVWAYLMLGDTFAFFLLTVFLKQEVGNDELFYKHFSALYGFVFFPLIALTYGILAACFSILLAELSEVNTDEHGYEIRHCMQSMRRRVTTGGIARKGASILQRHNTHSSTRTSAPNSFDQSLETSVRTWDSSESQIDDTPTDAERVSSLAKPKLLSSPPQQKLLTAPSEISRSKTTIPFRSSVYEVDENGKVKKDWLNNPILLQNPDETIISAESRARQTQAFKDFATLRLLTGNKPLLVPFVQDNEAKEIDAVTLPVNSELESGDNMVVYEDCHPTFDNQRHAEVFERINKGRTLQISLTQFKEAIADQNFLTVFDMFHDKVGALDYSEKCIIDTVFFNLGKNVNVHNSVVMVQGEILLNLFEKANHSGTYSHRLLGNALQVPDEKLHQRPSTLTESRLGDNKDSGSSSVLASLIKYGLASEEGLLKTLQKIASPYDGISTNQDKVWLSLQADGSATKNPSGNLLVPPTQTEENYSELWSLASKLIESGFKLHGPFEDIFNKYGKLVESASSEARPLTNQEINDWVRDALRISYEHKIWDTPQKRPKFDLKSYLEDNDCVEAKTFAHEFGRTKILSFLIHYNHVSVYNHSMGLKSLETHISELMMDTDKGERPVYIKFWNWLSNHEHVEGMSKFKDDA